MHLAKSFVFYTFLCVILGGCDYSGNFSSPSEQENNNTSIIYPSNSNVINNLPVVEDSIPNTCLSYTSNPKKIEYIKITIPESRRWAKNLLKAFIDPSKITNPKYRKRFNSLISFRHGNNICKFKASVRLSGDLKDHISMKNQNFLYTSKSPSIPIVSSLDVKMKTGNINGIIRYKLLLPESRNGDNEILTVSLFNQLGILTPRTRYVTVDINGTVVKMLLQEKFVKEFAEHNLLRESALLKTHEDLMWNLRSKSSQNFSSLIFPSIINRNWLKKNDLNKSISVQALNILSDASNRSADNVHTYQNFFNLQALANNNGTEEFAFYNMLSIITDSTHGLINHNERLLMLEDKLRPIYYDGDSNLLNRFNSLDPADSLSMIKRSKTWILNNAKHYNIEDYKKKIKNIDSYKLSLTAVNSGLNFSEIDADRLKIYLLKNLDYVEINLKEYSDNTNPEFTQKKDVNLQRFANNGLFNFQSFYGNPLGEYFLCEINTALLCNTYSPDSKKLVKLMTTGAKVNNLPTFYLNENKSSQVRKINLNQRTLVIEENFIMRIYGAPDVNVDKNERTINVYLKSAKDQVIINNSDLVNWEINVVALKNKSISPPNIRYNSELQTGALVIQDSRLKNVSFSFKGGMLEDSINIVRSSGDIKQIFIQDSYQDALDIDFSTISIANVRVLNAGNDCVDLSSGEYKIYNLNSKYCSDKSVSLGENSSLQIESMTTQAADAALVVKDSSKATVNNANIFNVKKCIQIYRKKQEYGGSLVNFPLVQCGNYPIHVQLNSELRSNDSKN